MKNTTSISILATTLLIMIGISVAGCKSNPVIPSTPAVPQGESATPTSLPVEPSETEEPAEVEATEQTDEAMEPVGVYVDVDPSSQIITFWHPFTGIHEETLREIVDTFNANNQWGITVRPEYQGGFDDLQNKMLTFIKTGELPNLLVVNGSQPGTYQLGNALIDLDPLIQHDTWGLSDSETSDFFPGILNQGIFPSFDNARLSFPMFGTMNVLYYNADWLSELGYGGAPVAPEPFLQAACSAMNQPFSGSTASGRVGYQVEINPSSFADWAFAFGGKFYDHGNNRYNFGNSAITSAMTFLQDLVNRGCAITSPASEENQIDFGRGVVLFTIDSTDKIPDYRQKVQAEANFNWRIAALPHSTTNPAANVSGTHASIPKTTPEGELAAWIFLKYFTSPEIQANWVEGTHALPVRRSSANYLSDYFASSPAYQMTLELLSQSIGEPSAPGYTPVQALSQKALQGILDGADITTTLDQLTANANQLLEEEMALLPESPDSWAEIDPSGQTITFWHQHTETRQAALEDIINEFNATNKWGITVIPVKQESYADIFLNLLPVLGTEEAPSLITAYPHQAAAYHLAGGLLDMNSLVESAKWGAPPEDKEDIFPGIFSQDISTIYEGIRLGYPVQRSTDVLYYNATWLAELGFDGPPATPEDFKQMACAAAAAPFNKSTAETSLGTHFYLDTTRFASWIFAFGGDIFDEDTNQFTYNNPATSEMLTFFMDLVESGCAAPSTDRIESQTAFGEGALLFMVDSSFHLPAVETIVAENQGFDWSVAAIPSNGDEPIQNIFGASISIPASTVEAQLAAWLFIQYFTTAEVQAKWGQGSNYLPIRGGASDYLGDYFADHPKYQTAFELLAYGIAEPTVPGYDFISEEVELALESIFAGADVLDTLTALNASANQLLTTHMER